MKHSQALLTVVDVATRKRDDAWQALAQAQREHQQAVMQMSQLQGYTAESLQRWTQRMGKGVSSTLLHTHHSFMGKLDHAVQFQDGVLQRLADNVARRQQAVVEAERELASLKKYLERRHDAWQRQVRRQEQKSTDELAATQHRQHSQTHPWRHAS